MRRRPSQPFRSAVLDSAHGPTLNPLANAAPKTLSTADSAVVIECYGFEGKAYIFRPMLGEVTLLYVISPEREVREVFSDGSYTSSVATDKVPADWRVLGWRPPNGERHGPYDRVDPAIADLAKLPLVNHASSMVAG